MNRKIRINKIKCNYCGDTIVSEHRHDFKFCSCGKVAVDDGNNAFGFIHAICAVQDRTVLTYRYLPEKLLEGLELKKDYEPFNIEDYEELSDEWEKEGLED